MKSIIRYIPLAAVMSLSVNLMAAETELPKTEILGKEYYYHEVQKGESVYGVAKKYGWDLEELVRLNPATSSQMKKGSRLYYPTGRVAVVTEISPDQEEKTPELEPIRHTVKRGETVYGISKQYGIPLETIYAAYPEARYGIKAGEILELPQSASIVSDKYLYYVIKPGDTLYSLAKRYHTTVEALLEANPGVSERNFRIGDTLRIGMDTGKRRIHTELVEESRLASIDTYKVKKNDTWSTISKKTGVDVETLRDANEETKRPEKNDIITIPVIETVQVEKEVEQTDPRELTPEGIREIYDSIHRIDSDVEELREVRVALLLDDPKGKKDIDFTRGMLLALEEKTDAPYKIDFKVVDGRASTADVTGQLDSFGPDILFATADKAFPAFLADYGEKNHIEIINAFDVRNDLFEDNPAMVQVLPPSNLFNEQVAERIADDYKDYELIMVGPKDDNDAIAEQILKSFAKDDVRKFSVSSLPDHRFADSGKYLLYCYPQKKEEVNEILAAIGQIREESGYCDITLVGRPSWITLTESFRDNFNGAEVVVPARCWFDPESDEGKDFEERYSETFGGTPVKSFPNFAVSGYDLANFFIDTTVKNGGDFNKAIYAENRGLQTDYDLKRVSNWSGFVNPAVYLVRFMPSGYVEKVMVR